MTISDTFIPLFAEAVGTIQSVKGRLVVRHGDTVRAYYAAPGNQLYENDVLYTLEDSRSRLKFVTDEIITMGANSHVRVDQVVDNRPAQEKSSVFSMLKGKAMFYALRLFRYKKVNVDVRTPTAVAGIRGTKFGVEVEQIAARQASSGPVYLADASGTLPTGLLAQNTPGEGFQTTVYGFDGEVEVTATADGSTQTVGAGENVVVGAIGAGEVMPTSPEQAQQFNAETAAPAEDTGGSEGAGESGNGETEGAAAEEPAIDSTAARAEANASEFSQNQTAQENQEQAGLDQPAPVVPPPVVAGINVGYFSALLTRQDVSVPELADVYANSSRADFEGTEVSGSSIVNPAGFITATNTSSSSTETFVKQINTVAGGPFDSGDLGATRPMDNDTNTLDWPVDEDLGVNAFMEWGFWRMSRWVFVPGTATAYAITDRAYNVSGVATPDAAAAGVVGTYAGSAWGTYFSGQGGSDMVGSFICNIDVPAKTVTGFNLSVSGVEGPTAEIIDGAGSFIGSTGEFKLTGGSWLLNGITAVNKSLCGSLYGPAAEHIGGAWAMDAGTGNNAAVGIFVGDKGGTPTIPAFPVPIPPPLPPIQSGVRTGYFSGLLTEDPDGQFLADVYVSNSPQDFNSSLITAAGLFFSAGSIEANPGSGFSNAFLERVSVNPEASSVLGSAFPINNIIIGINAFQEWGHWTVAQPFVINTVDHDFNNKGYYIFGQPTPDASVNGISGQYVGPAFGTFWTDTGGIDMTGAVSMNVAGLSNQVTDFNLAVSDSASGAAALIGGEVGATGTLSGSAFTINPDTGTWQLVIPGTTPTPVEPIFKSAHGSLYGPNGEFMGGAWGMGTSTGQGAAGIFQGDKVIP
jgi:hypothetical protein